MMASFSQETVNALQLAVDEACANVIEHAYQGDESNTIDVDIVLKADRVTVRIRDEGEPFLDNDCRRPDIFEYAANKRSGGFGVHLIRTLADLVEYSSRGRSNVCSVTMFRNDSARSARSAASTKDAADGAPKSIGRGKPGTEQRVGPSAQPTKRTGNKIAPPPAKKKTVRRKKG
jgi:serine/threonine-protein kinase RsbW